METVWSFAACWGGRGVVDLEDGELLSRVLWGDDIWACCGCSGGVGVGGGGCDWGGGCCGLLLVAIGSGGR